MLFEVFCSRSQVWRHLRILDKTDADIKVAVIVDKEVDSAVLAAFLKENPESDYPFLLISELFEEPPIMCSLKLSELVSVTRKPSSENATGENSERRFLQRMSEGRN